MMVQILSAALAIAFAGALAAWLAHSSRRRWGAAGFVSGTVAAIVVGALVLGWRYARGRAAVGAPITSEQAAIAGVYLLALSAAALAFACFSIRNAPPERFTWSLARRAASSALLGTVLLIVAVIVLDLLGFSLGVNRLGVRTA